MQDRQEAASVRPARPGDVDTIVEFCCALALETENRHLDPSVVRTGVIRALGDEGICRYFLAELEERVVGQVMITYEWSDWRAGVFWWIQSVYIRPEFRRRGVFRALYDHLRTRAREKPGVCGFRLYVDQANRRAMRAYEDLGLTRMNHVLYEQDWSRVAETRDRG
jgi:ribosomal protein S18 acetylase RimI-like enzyme